MHTSAALSPRAFESLRSRPTWLGWGMLLLPVIVLDVALFLSPLGGLLMDSFRGNSYQRLLEDPLVRKSLTNTFWISSVSTIVTLVLGYLVAYVIWRQKALVRVILFALVLLPFWTGVLVKNFAWAVLLQDHGLVNGLLQSVGLTDGPVQLLHTRLAVVVGMSHYLLPFAIFPIFASLSAQDDRVEQAARSLGAGGMQVFRRVILPLSLPGVSAAGLLVFIICTGFFVTPVVLGGPADMMVANQIDFYARKLTDFRAASALAVVLTVAVSFLAAVYQRALRSGGQHDV
jgi:ABC-type spermidine/putrescine transport system permease subunit I